MRPMFNVGNHDKRYRFPLVNLDHITRGISKYLTVVIGLQLRI